MKFTAVFFVPTLLIVLPTGFMQADELDDYIRQEMDFLRVPGLSVAIAQGELPARFRAYGRASLENPTPVTKDTVFQIGSLTKQFTATAIMLLVEDGKLSLDDTIDARLADLPAAWNRVTIRQLLSHTSGVKDYTAQSGFAPRRRLETKPDELLALVQAAPLEFPPGTRYGYSNTNYLLLALLIERISGQSCSEFLAARILTPLAMAQTGVNDPSEIVANRAQGYSRIPGRTQNAVFFSPTNAFGAGDLRSCAEDLMKWETALETGKLLSKDRVAEMWTPASLSPGGAAPYGFGWAIKTERGQRLVSHGGNITGFSSAYLHCPELHLTVVVLANLGEINAERLAFGVAGKLEPTLAKPPPPPTLADPEPQLTARLQRVFLGMMNGEVSAEDFDEKLNRELVPLKMRGAAGDKVLGAENGRLTLFELVARQPSAGGLVLQYRAAFEHRMRPLVFITLDADGKISNWGVRSAD